MKTFGFLWLICLLIGLAFWSAVIYAVIHFVMKWW